MRKPLPSAADKTTFTIHVPEGQYFLLGDNRLVSQDSRQLGTFTRKDIFGEVKFRASSYFGPGKILIKKHLNLVVKLGCSDAFFTN